MRFPAGARAPALAAGAGLAVLGAHPPLGWWPLSFLAPGLFLAALWVHARATPKPPRRHRAVFGLGTLMGAATFAPMLSWLIMPAGAVGWALLAGIQALWLGLLAVLMAPIATHRLAPIALAVGWTGIDAWRALVPLNGFEWGAIAYAHVDGSWLLPVARVLGGRGITFLVVLIGAAAAMAARAFIEAARRDDEAPMERRLRSTNVPIAMLVTGLLLSVLITVEPPPEEGSIEVLAVQGNGLRHWEDGAVDPDRPLRIARALREETLAAIARDGVPDLTVWPESSVDRDPHSARGAPLGEIVDEVADEVGLLFAGATLDGPSPEDNRYVSGVLYQGGLQEVDRYTKRRLVPFGEYIPMRQWLDWYSPLDQIPRDTLPGPNPDTITLPGGIELAPIICFETMFSDVVRTNILAGDTPAQLLATVTNDASFGDSGEPAQHLAQSQLRSVETGRWTIHAALSGSSAFVSPTGELHQATEIFTVDSIRSQVPLVGGLTPYLQVGDVVGWVTRTLTLAGLLLLLATGLYNRRRERSAPVVPKNPAPQDPAIVPRASRVGPTS